MKELSSEQARKSRPLSIKFLIWPNLQRFKDENKG